MAGKPLATESQFLLGRWLLLPGCLAVLALFTDWLPAKMGVPLVCALILLCSWLKNHESTVLGSGTVSLFVVAAFVFSAAGDYFLSNMASSPGYFVIGIGLYLFAHLGYLGFAWRCGRVNRPVLVILMLIFLPYGLLVLRPVIADSVLLLAVVSYLLISCLGLAVACGSRLDRPSNGLFAMGIGLIVVSDTIISLTEFLHFDGLNWLILPTYYLAHMGITSAILALLPMNRDNRTLLEPNTAKGNRA